MKYLKVCSGSISMAAIAAASSFFVTPSTAERPGAYRADALPAELIEIREQRVRLIVDEQVPAMAHPHNRPGLHLLFRLPELDDRGVLEFTAVRRLEARDSEGRDLTELAIEGQRDPEQVDLMWGAEPEYFLISLGLPQRTAQHFDAQAELELLTYESTETLTVEVSDEWETLELPGSMTDELRIRFDGNRAMPGLVIQPGTARRAIESVEFVTDSGRWTSNFSSWTDEEARYFFQGIGEVSEGKANLTVRSKMRAVPIRITIEGESLR